MSPAPPHHLPWRAREDQAPLTHAHGGSRGYGFVELATAVQAERAKTMLDGRAVSYGGRMPTTLVVRSATRPSAGHVPAPPIAGRLLWVGNLSFASRPASPRLRSRAPALVPSSPAAALVSPVPAA